MKKITYSPLRGAARSERGQSVVIIAIVMVGLIALMGLAIDGGNLFMQRRRAQNAADAAAMAGTQLIALAIQTCDPIDQDALDEKIARTVNRYAENNGVSDTNGTPGDAVNDNVVAYYVDADENRLGRVGQTGELPIGTTGIEVEVEDVHRTFFVSILGIDTAPSSAEATAITGVVTEFPAGGGILPIAVPEFVVYELETGQEWEVADTGNGQFCYDDGGTEVCLEVPGAPQNSQRGWLNLNFIYNDLYLESNDSLNRTFERNLSNSGCETTPPGLRGYASGDCPYAHPIYSGTSGDTDGDFIHGDSGARQSSLDEIYEHYDVGQTAIVPVFDRVYLREEMVERFDGGAEDPEAPGNGGGWPGGGGGEHAYFYHIVGYTAITVGEDPGGHVLSGAFQYAHIAAGVLPTSYTGSCNPVLHGVSLWE